MNPTAALFLDRLQANSIRYVIPVYQRMYSWGIENCEQLWKDIVAVGESESGQHFTGSIVWVQDGAMTGNGDITALLIDGQQRMTTLSLLIVALASYGKEHEGEDLNFKWKKIVRDYLLHDEDLDPGDPQRYKLTLTEEDNETFHSLIDELVDPSAVEVRTSRRISENYEHLRQMLDSIANPNIVWSGMRRLQVISVCLDQGVDNPQAIFESMNSTGKDLSAADLVRNYVLMGLPVKEQNRLYKNYWRPIERLVGAEESDERFDEFLKDYLIVVCAPEPVNPKDVYPVFKRRVIANDWRSVEETERLLSEMKRHAGYFCRIAIGSEHDRREEPGLFRQFYNLRRLGVSVVNPLLMEFLDASSAERGMIDPDTLPAMLTLVESYLLRRAICDCASNSLNKFFCSVIAKLRSLDGELPYDKVFSALLELEEGSARRFPGDAEFANALCTRNIYSFRKAFYLLTRLENSFHPKDAPIDFSDGNYSIEHIMPQNALAHLEWVEMLGGEEAAQETHGRLLHTLGNLTVTAYNSELSDGTFEQKKQRFEGGFNYTVISLSEDCRKAETWGQSEIEKRAERLAERAKALWPSNCADKGLVEQMGKRPKRASSAAQSVTLKMLVQEDYVPKRATLIHMGASGAEKATITDDARVELPNGETFGSLSLAAIRCIELRTGTRRTQNGWTYWCVEDEGSRLLDDIRSQYRDDHGMNREESDWNSWHMDFWEDFYAIASDMPDFCEAFGDLGERKPNRSYFCDLFSGTPGRHISLSALTSKRNLGVCCGEYFTDPDSYSAFYERRQQIEESLALEGVEWHWDDPSSPKKSRNPYAHKRFDLDDPEERMQAYSWLIEASWAFKKVFG